jgi:hypothetical protein
VLIILDPTDSNKSCLVDANTIRKTSDVLNKLYEDAQAKSATFVFEEGEITTLLVLSSASSASIPKLVPEALDATIESVLPPQPSNTDRPRLTRSAKIKAESDQGDSSSDDDSEIPKTDWPKAYESFFHILAGSKKNGIPNHDLSVALPQIRGVVDIALRHDAVHAVQGTFDSLFYGYVGKDTLWKSIATEPVPCLKIAIALQNLPVYEEAFKHIVGTNASFKHGKQVDGLSDDVQAIVQRRSRDLYLKRRDVEDELSRISILAHRTPTSRAAPVSQDYPSKYVSQHNQPVAYNTVNLVRDWMTDHIGHLRNETDQELPESYLCDHSRGCDSVAGFFRAIKTHNYLNPDEVWDNMSDRFKDTQAQRHNLEREIVKNTLEVLKTKAAGFVEEISRSTLRLTGEVGYLTCVKVEAEDVPWAVEEESDRGSDGGSDDDG